MGGHEHARWLLDQMASVANSKSPSRTVVAQDVDKELTQAYLKKVFDLFLYECEANSESHPEQPSVASQLSK